MFFFDQGTLFVSKLPLLLALCLLFCCSKYGSQASPPGLPAFSRGLSQLWNPGALDSYPCLLKNSR